MHDLPVIIMEVSSNEIHELDKNHMKLQASCLVCLGNALREKEDFIMKAIYIHSSYHVTEYTFFQGSDPIYIPTIAKW